mgnify:CR=1 FL=1
MAKRRLELLVGTVQRQRAEHVPTVRRIQRRSRAIVVLQRSSPGCHDRLRIPAHLRELTTQPREAALALRRGRRGQRGGQRLPGGDQLLSLWSLNTSSALARAGGLRIP